MIIKGIEFKQGWPEQTEARCFVVGNIFLSGVYFFTGSWGFGTFFLVMSFMWSVEFRKAPSPVHLTHEALPEESITCPRCGRTSYNPNDVSEGYCGNCHDWTSPRRV